MHALPRMISLEAIFVALLGVQLLVIAGHDWITVPGWNHARSVQAAIGRRKLAWATAINAMFPAAALLAALWFWQAPKPLAVRGYWVAYATITVGSAIAMWWLPYFFGTSRDSRPLYRKMYDGTRHVLPERNGDPGPNAAHLVFHGLFLATLAGAVAMFAK